MSQYKNTLNLPKTDFPMKAGLTRLEPELLRRWEEGGLYRRIQEARKDAPEYILHDGPPFSNGDLHMGHALNKILKDLVIKSKTMAGFRAPFVPGWDCHGLPIEFKVVKESAGLAPVEVRKKSEAYARKYIAIQKDQFRRMGVLGDWEHPYLTLDPGYEAHIIRAFASFVEKDLVYRSKKPVFWSTGAQTALAEAEVEYQDKTSPAVFVRFELTHGPLAGEGAVVIWTTTPWTLPANLAIAVHPKHKYVLAELPGAGRVVAAADRLGHLAQKTGGEPRVLREFPGEELSGARARHPFIDREATIHTADFVTLDSGTGCVHVAPGHGEDDYLLGLREGLELLSPVDDNGRFTEACGVPELIGKYVFDANEEVIRILGERRALVAREDHFHTYPFCWRSKTPVIFRAVEQFFIRIDALRDAALRGIDAVEWLPHWGRNRIRGTVESRPDWCISRQRTWGVPLPVFYDAAGAPLLDAGKIRCVAEIVAEHGTNAWFEKDDAWWNEQLDLPRDTIRRNDTIDVWIDSGVSHEAVLRTHPELRFPADLYLEATDQHRGWFQSSLMTSIAMSGEAPYRSVLTHGFVVDVDTRKKFSKSAQGGYQKPTEAGHYVDKYGADLLRLWVCSVNFTDDVPFSEEIFTRLSDAYRRIRNTLRILLANLNDFDPAAHTVEPSAMPMVDRWILAELDELTRTCRKAYDTLEFHRVYQELTQFCAVELSSLYIDITKDRLYCDTPAAPRRRATQTAMHRVFDGLCRLIAPILAFTADEAWGFFGRSESVHLESFPECGASNPDSEALAWGRAMLKVRARISQAVERAQQDKIIGKPLEALVRIDAPAAERPAGEIGELEEFFVLSHLEWNEAPEWNATVSATPHQRCDRCWRHRPDTGAHAAHPALCGRCAEAVESIQTAPAD